MKNEDETAQPKKLLLGKRVLRHFHVRTSIQTGAGTTYTATQDPNSTSTQSTSVDDSDDSNTSKQQTYSSIARCR